MRAIVQVLCGQHLVGVQAQRHQHLGKQGWRWGLALQRRGGKSPAAINRFQAHQTHTTFLHKLATLPGLATGLKPSVGRAQCRVARKRQLSAGREDPYPVIGPARSPFRRGRQHKGGFAQLRPAGKGLHLRVRQAIAVQHHGQRVAQKGRVGEDVDLLECAGFHGGVQRQVDQSDSRIAAANALMPVLIWSTVAVTKDRRKVLSSAPSA